MADQGHGQATELDALLAERSRYEEWLRALEQKQDATPRHIFERVRADYSARLDRVAAQLQTHRAAVDRMIDGVNEEMRRIDAEEGRHRDARAEAELRALIGEYSEERCAAALARADEAIAGLALEKGRLGAELARLRSILDGPATGDQAPPTVVPTPVEEPIVLDEDPLAEEDTSDGAAPAMNGSAPGDVEGGMFQRPAQPANAAFDELEFLKTVTGADAAGTATNAGPGASAHAAASDEAETAEVDPAEGMRPFLRTTPTEQVKTLRCQECQTMNYPTEWYCERCGAELAAL